MKYAIDERTGYRHCCQRYHPMLIGALTEARKKGIITGCLTCNAGSPLADAAELPVEGW